MGGMMELLPKDYNISAACALGGHKPSPKPVRLGEPFAYECTCICGAKTYERQGVGYVERPAIDRGQ